MQSKLERITERFLGKLIWFCCGHRIAKGYGNLLRNLLRALVRKWRHDTARRIN